MRLLFSEQALGYYLYWLATTKNWLSGLIN